MEEEEEEEVGKLGLKRKKENYHMKWPFHASMSVRAALFWTAGKEEGRV